jgi:hypothetical protein
MANQRTLLLTVIFVCATCVFCRIGTAQMHDDVTLFGSNGSHLLEICSEETPRVGDVVPATQLVTVAKDKGMCWGYISGINDNEMSHVASASGKGRRYCLPSGVDLDQLRKVVRQYLDNNPARLHLPSEILVISALEQAFPCS